MAFVLFSFFNTNPLSLFKCRTHFANFCLTLRKGIKSFTIKKADTKSQKKYLLRPHQRFTKKGGELGNSAQRKIMLTAGITLQKIVMGFKVVDEVKYKDGL